MDTIQCIVKVKSIVQYMRSILVQVCRCPSTDWRAIDSPIAPRDANDRVPLIAMRADLRREKLSLHLIQLIVLL